MAKEELTVSITNCINKCISSNTFPDELKNCWHYPSQQVRREW